MMDDLKNDLNENVKPPYEKDSKTFLKTEILSKFLPEDLNFESKRQQLLAKVTEMGNTLKNTFADVENKMKHYEGNLKVGLIELAAYGWYTNYDSSLIDVARTIRLTNEKDMAELDKYMSDQINSQLKYIQSTLLQRHPQRAEPIKAAFRAHKRKEYYLSIPVIFAQCDGISKDLSTVQFFLTDQKKEGYSPKVAKWAKEVPKISFHIAMAAALLEKGAFQLHSSQPNKIGFTRHSVIHGETNDYGTKINSLKAISLIIYISDIMSPRKIIDP